MLRPNLRKTSGEASLGVIGVDGENELMLCSNRSSNEVSLGGVVEDDAVLLRPNLRKTAGEVSWGEGGSSKQTRAGLSRLTRGLAVFRSCRPG
jgi:hypothetical protein